jgi:ribosomal protein S18 acetylase RimI-like enzyme
MMCDVRDGAPYLAEVHSLIQAYLTELGEDLSFQALEAERSDLAQMYGAPRGALCVVVCDQRVVGCGALRTLAPGVAEMKRVYVQPSHRGLGLGHRLVQALEALARNRGDQRIVLDTLERLEHANRLYEKYGYRVCEPYYANPIADARFYQKAL